MGVPLILHGAAARRDVYDMVIYAPLGPVSDELPWIREPDPAAVHLQK